MYSPYVFGRKFELLALRTTVTEGGKLNQLIPLVEPVLTSSTPDLLRCIDAFSKASQPIVIEVNPSKHDYSGDAAPGQVLRKALQPNFINSPSVMPGLRISSATTKKTVDGFFRIYPDRPVALLLTSPSLTTADMTAAVMNKNVAYIFVLDDRITSVQLNLIPVSKLIETRDNFNKLQRNSDYQGTELFTDRHKGIGKRCAGVGDYTVVGRELVIGGGQPDAVAIHAIFKDPTAGDIWMQHFVSTDKDRHVGTVATKFLQAATQFVNQVHRRRPEFGNNEAIRCYEAHVRASHSPGLGKNKELQIRHHIRLMLDVIGGVL